MDIELKPRNKTAFRNAVLLGSMCSIAYLAVYVAKYILSQISPQITTAGVLDKDKIGTLSSLYFIVYAVGQLINGIIGDRIKAKYMISFGLAFGGGCLFVFSQTIATFTVAKIAYASMGFFLAMIYAPLSKLVAENTEPIYTTRCSLGYTFASLLGSPAAGLLAMFLTWQWVLRVGSSILVAMGIICFLVLSIFERKKIVEYGKYKQPKSGEKHSGGIKTLIEHDIIKYSFVSILTGVVRTTVVFWMPTYFNEYLGFSPDRATLIASVSTIILSLSAFMAVFSYEKIYKFNLDKTVLFGFIISAALFLLLWIIKIPMLNVIIMVLAVLFCKNVDNIMWSRYCPSLRDTGMVSTATGYLDFLSYIAASLSSKLFASAATGIGWNGLILVWLGLMVAGIAVSFPYKKIFKKRV
ncbi:MAG: MFS transporter [Clostridia bacterium]|nr:MFS transporter [Clostridia bacterium]